MKHIAAVDKAHQAANAGKKVDWDSVIEEHILNYRAADFQTALIKSQ